MVSTGTNTAARCPPAPNGSARRCTISTLPRSYIEHLRTGNTTDHWGETLHTLWQQTSRGAPIAMTSALLSLGDRLQGDGFERDPR
jgi:hypothetical protein